MQDGAAGGSGLKGFSAMVLLGKVLAKLFGLVPKGKLRQAGHDASA